MKSLKSKFGRTLFTFILVLASTWPTIQQSHSNEIDSVMKKRTRDSGHATPVTIVAAYSSTGRKIPRGGIASRVDVRPLDIGDVEEGGAPSVSRILPIVSIQLSYPQIVAAKVGMIINFSQTPEAASGILIQLEAGLQGLGGSVGYGLEGDLETIVDGLSFKISTLYTLNILGNSEGNLGIQADQLYLGPEIDVLLGPIELSLGALFRAAGAGGVNAKKAQSWLIKAGAGIRF